MLRRFAEAPIAKKGTKRVLLTRPQADSERIAPDFKALGYDVAISPVLEIQLFNPDLPPHNLVCLSSKNALPALEKLSRSTPIFCVGAYTASLLRSLGFKDVRETPTAVDLLGLLKKETGHILYLAGAQTRLDFSKHLTNCEKVICYEARAVEGVFDGKTTHIPLYSVRSAKLLNKLLIESKINSKEIIFLALSQDIAHAVQDIDYKEILVAKEPTHQALLNLLIRK